MHFQFICKTEVGIDSFGKEFSYGQISFTYYSNNISSFLQFMNHFFNAVYHGYRASHTEQLVASFS